MLRLRYFALAATALSAVLASSQIIACATDDSGTPKAAIDAGPTPEGGPSSPADGGTVIVTSPGPLATVAATRGILYLGQTAKLDGAAIAPDVIGVRWEVIAVPPQSRLDTTSLSAPTSTTPTFTPDQLGTYTFRINGTKAGADVAIVVLVDAIDAPVFWVEGHLKGSSQNGGEYVNTTFTSAIHVGGVSGGADREVACLPRVGSVTTIEDIFNYAEPIVIASANGDVWEGPPGTPSRVVQPDLSRDRDDAGEPLAVASSITVATSSATCAGGEAKQLELVVTPRIKVDNGGTEELAYDYGNVIASTKLSPDATRIAYVHNAAGKARISTIGFDGTAKRDLAPFEVTAGGTLDPNEPLRNLNRSLRSVYVLGPVKPRWRDATHIGWIALHAVVDQTPPEWELYVVEDAPGATAERVMHCSSLPDSEFDFLPDGSIVIGQYASASTAGGAGVTPDKDDIVVMRPNATTKECEVVRNLTKNTTDLFMHGLALSPDKTTLAFLSKIPVDAEFARGSLFTVPVDGSRPMTRVPGAGLDITDGTGVRWAAGGTSLVRGKNEAFSYSPAGSLGPRYYSGGVQAIAVDGGMEHDVSSGQHDHPPYFGDVDASKEIDLRVVYGYGQGCATSPVGTGSSTIGIVAAICAAMLFGRRRRATLVLAAAAVVGCGSDNGPKTAPTPTDAGVATSDAGPTVTPPRVIVEKRTPEAHVIVYVGQTAQVDASVGAAADAVWQVLSAPIGSTITTASLQGGTGATPSFAPDVLGTYVLQTTVARDGGAGAFIVLVDAVDVPIFWRENHQSGMSDAFTYVSITTRATTHAGGVYGRGDRELDCPLERAGGYFELGEQFPVSISYGASVSDAWEAPAGTASRLALLTAKLAADPHDDVQTLVALTSESSCATGGGKVLLEGEKIVGVRLSPDATRVAYLAAPTATRYDSRLGTIAFDGAAKRDLAPAENTYYEGNNSTNAGVLPRWRDATHVVWANLLDTRFVKDFFFFYEWELHVVEDKEGAVPELLMHCANSQLSSFDLTADGLVIASVQHDINSEDLSGPMDIFVYRPNPTTKECEVVRNLTNNVDPEAVARELALSPDKKTVAFLAGRSGPRSQHSPSTALPQIGMDLYVATAPVDGSAAPARVPGSTKASWGRGVRWVAGGTSLSWGVTTWHKNANLSDSLLVIPARGGTPRFVAEGSYTEITPTGGTQFPYKWESRSMSSIGQGCGVSPGPSSGALGVGFILTALIARRRRRRRVPS